MYNVIVILLFLFQAGIRHNVIQIRYGKIHNDKANVYSDTVMTFFILQLLSLSVENFNETIKTRSFIV